MTERKESNTKIKFMNEALRLFSEKGFESVSVAEIAEAVGCSAPALYKHFKSKQELLDIIIKDSEEAFKEQMRLIRVDFDSNSEVAKTLLEYTEEQEIDRIQYMIKSAVHTPKVQLFRKLCAVEQFNMPKLAEIYTYRYITFQIEQTEHIFEALMNCGKLKKTDPRVLARMYMSVPTMVIGVIDREPGREEECMKLIEDHIREFNRCYRIQ